MLFVAVPWAMSFRTLCLPCGICRPRYALRIFRPTMPSTYASPRAVSLVVFTDMAIVRREISSSISYTASFLGTICLEVPSPIPTVFFLHLTVALQRRTVYDFLISGHLLPDRELREREHLEQQELPIDDDAVRSLLDNQLRRYFAEQIEGRDELEGLTEQQITEMVTAPNVPQCIRRQLEKNGFLIDSFWESVAKASSDLVRQYKEKLV